MENIPENELARRMGCLQFSEKKITRICAFFQQNKHFCNFMATSLSLHIAVSEQFLNQIECI
jgi:hypothetical protein